MWFSSVVKVTVAVALAKGGFSFSRHIKDITVCTIIKGFVNSRWSAEKKSNVHGLGRAHIPVGWDLQKP